MSCLCEYAIAICPKTGTQCTHRNDMESCQLSRVSGIQHATFAVCMDLYKGRRDISSERKRSLCRSVQKSLGLVGLSVDSHVDAMTYRKFKELIEIMESAPDGRVKYSKETISTKLSEFRALGSECMRDSFEEKGFSRPMFDIPKYKTDRRTVRGMTSAEAFTIKQWMWRLSNSTKRMDGEVFKALFFEREFAVRPGDINRMTWSAIVHENGKHYLRYTPNKTAAYGKRSNIVIGEDLWRWIQPYVGRQDEPVLGFDGRGRRRTTGQTSRHRAVWNIINRMYREHGICDHGAHGKASYLNRRARISEAFQKHGFRGAMAVGLNTPKVEVNHYISVGEYEP